MTDTLTGPAEHQDWEYPPETSAEGAVSPTEFARIVNERTDHTVTPQNVYGWLKRKKAPLTALEDGEGKPMVDVAGGLAWLASNPPRARSANRKSKSKVPQRKRHTVPVTIDVDVTDAIEAAVAQRLAEIAAKLSA